MEAIRLPQEDIGSGDDMACKQAIRMILRHIPRLRTRMEEERNG